MNRTALLLIHASLALVTAATTLPAQNSQKVALAPVQAASTLLRKFDDHPVSTSTASKPAVTDSSGMAGEWKGTANLAARGRGVNDGPVRLTISLDKDGSYQADFAAGEAFPSHSKKSERNGNQVRFSFPAPRAGRPDWTVVVNFKPEDQSMAVVWNRPNQVTRFTASRTSSSAESTTAARTPEPVPGTMRPSVNPPIHLEDILHKMDVHLANSIRAERLFDVMESTEFNGVMPTQSGFDFKNADSQQRLKHAGIDYVLVTTVEGFQDQTLDYKEWSGLYHQYSSSGRTAANYNNSATVTWGRQAVGFSQQSALESVFARQGQSSLVQMSKESQKLQLLFLEIECKLYDARTGELRDSGNYSFVTNRFYAAVANTSNYRDTGDLYLDAAKAISASTTVWMVNVINPMVILKKEEKTVTINRGLGAHLRVGDTYTVYSLGQEMFDPNTHQSLGREEITIGKVAIVEVHDKFSTAMILEDEKGIMGEGNTLRAATR